MEPNSGSGETQMTGEMGPPEFVGKMPMRVVCPDCGQPECRKVPKSTLLGRIFRESPPLSPAMQDMAKAAGEMIKDKIEEAPAVQERRQKLMDLIDKTLDGVEDTGEVPVYSAPVEVVDRVLEIRGGARSCGPQEKGK